MAFWEKWAGLGEFHSESESEVDVTVGWPCLLRQPSR
jgi:hypothetical protein